MSQNLEFDIDQEQWNFVSAEMEGKEVFMTEAKADYIYNEIEKLFSNLAYELNQSNGKSVNAIYLDSAFQIQKLLSSCFTENPNLLIECQDQNYQKIFTKYLQAAELCLKCLLSCLDKLQDIHASKPIIQVSLTILHQSYSHCKDSETYYGKFFEDFTNLLGDFYNQMQEVQNAVLKLLDELINANSCQENTFDDIVVISQKIGELSELITSLDRMTAIVFWKMFLKLISKYKTRMQGNFEIDNFTLSLVLDIKNIIKCCCHKIELEEQIDKSEIKVCIFELSSLKKIMDLFGEFLKENTLIQIRDLFLVLYNLLIQYFSATNIQEKDFNVIKILLQTAKPVILTICCNSHFINLISSHNITDLPRNSQMPLIVLKSIIVNFIKLNLGSFKVLLHSGNILTDFFSLLCKNSINDDFQFVSLKFPRSLFKDIEANQLEFVTLYDHSYNSLIDCCKLITCSSNEAHLLEKTWLNLYNSSSDVVSLFISDVWIYYLRCGTIEKVYRNCEMLSEIISTDTSSKVNNLLIRMMKFLPTNQKIKLIESKKYLFKIFNYHKQMCRFELPNSNNPFPIQQVLCEKLNSILSNATNSELNSFDRVVDRAVSFLDLCSICVDKFSSSDMLKLIELLISLAESGVYEIQSTIIVFLQSLNGKTLSNNAKEVDVLTSAIAMLLCSLMNSTNYITRMEAFNLYFNLARSTPHSEMIKKTVMKSPNLLPRIKSFAEKVPISGFLGDEQRRLSLQTQLSKSLHFNYTIENCYSDETKHVLHSFFI